MSETPERTVRHYELHEIIGTGGMGDVFRATDARTGQPVAIKRLKITHSANVAAQLQRFQREADVLRRLNHPNIVHMVETFEHDGQYFIVMEYIPGGSLREVLESGQVLTIERVLSLGLDIADALTRVHRLNIIHRDLKPGNILLAEDGSARLTDFGVAYLASLPPVTQTGALVGTTPYLSPEALNGEAIDERVDIWAFGVLLFEMLAGLHPFEGDGATTPMLRAILFSPPADLEALRPGAPLALVDLVYRMLDKDRQARISSVRLVGAELEAIARHFERPAHAAITRRPGPEIEHTTPGDRRDWSLFATPVPAPDVPHHNLPAQTTPFIGRETELDELAHLLHDPQVRLITILGPGGMGKTRLSLEAAARHAAQWPHGVGFAPLAAAIDPAAIIPALAEALRFEFYQGGSPKQQLFDFLREKALLIVLDNFEQLVEGADLLADLLEAAPRLKLLVTSRERLALSAETIFPLGGIDIPHNGPEAIPRDHTAVRLFESSARRVWPGYEIGPDDLPHIARICRDVAGMPLGIVLAAAWVDVLSPREIADEIEASLDFLATEMRDIPDRQRSIRAIVEATWARLDEAGQQAFFKLSVFRGGFTRQAAQSITAAASGAPPGETGVTLRQLMTLANKALLRRDPDTGRYEVHELLRQYAAHQLEAAGEAAAVRDAHSAYYLEAVAAREEALKGPREVEARDDIEADVENVRAAWLWAVQRGHWQAAGRAMEALTRFFTAQHRRADGRALFQAAVDALESGEHPALLGGALVRLASFTDDLGQSQALIERGLGLLRDVVARGEAGPELLAGPLMALAVILVQRGEPDRAQALYEESRALAETHGDRWTLAWVNRNLGLLAGWVRGDIAAGEHYMQQALSLFRDIGLQTGIANTLYALAALVHMRGDRAETLRLNQEALEIFRTTRSRMGEAVVLCAMGWQSYMIGDYEQSRRSLEDSLRIRRILGDQGRVPHENLSFTLQALGDDAAARDHLRAALNILAQARNPGSAVYMVISSAMLLARRGNARRAAQLIGLALAHPALEPDGRQLAESLRGELEQQLGPEALAAESAQGAALDLDATITALVGEV